MRNNLVKAIIDDLSIGTMAGSRKVVEAATPAVQEYTELRDAA
jgi:hypothetical protein